MTRTNLKILSLQPWYGGSHRQFADDWAKRSSHNWTTVGLPDRNWKWRMRNASIDFARQIRALSAKGQHWDVVFCTDMMNVAELRSLAEPIRDLPMVVYFHENQFAYPTRGKKQPDHHFLLTNFVSALAADEVWFNSQFNFDSLLKGLRQHADIWPDFDPTEEIKSIASKAKIVPLPIEAPVVEEPELVARRNDILSGNPLHIVWAARWEHDKNPADLLQCLKLLKQQKVPFRLSVIGAQADSIPEEFSLIREKFELQIDNWGYQPDRESYWSVLKSADIFVSTAAHEFFGLGVVEGIVAGAWPLLPLRLSYPELLEVDRVPDRTKHFFYQQSAKQLASKIRELHQNRSWDFESLDSLARDTAARLRYQDCVKRMDQMLLDCVHGEQRAS